MWFRSGVQRGATGQVAMVGREVERSELRAALARAALGRGGVAIVLGEAGMGKSMIAAWLEGEAVGAGMRVARGACSAAGMPPLWAWRSALHDLVDVAWEQAASVPDAAARGLLAAAVVDGLVAVDKPVLIVLEDVHWADPATVLLAQAIVAELPTLPVLLVMTCRDDEDPGAGEVRAALAQLPASVRRVWLGPIGGDEVRALASGVLDRDLTDVESGQLLVRCGGNPFFVHEVAMLLSAHGPSAMVVPPGVREVLERRVARVSQPCASLLACAALAAETAEERVDVDLLAEVRDITADEANALLDEAFTAGLVDLDAERGPGYRFRHALIREVVGAGLPAAERGLLQARLAGLLEAAGEPAARIASHWRRASGEAAPAQAALWSLRAAREAMSALGYELAAAHYARAAGGPMPDKVTVLIEWGEASHLAGDVATSRATLRSAAADAERTRRPEQLARAALAMGGGLAGFEVATTDDEQADLLERAQAALPAEAAGLRAAVDARLSLLHASRMSPAARVALVEGAVRLAAKAHEPLNEAAALAAYCDAVAGPDHVAERVAAASRILMLVGDGDAAVTRNAAAVLLARRLLVVANLERGDLAEAAVHAAAYERVARRVGSAVYLWLPEIWRGMRALLDGEPEAALRHAECAEGIGRRAASANADLMVFAVRMHANLALGSIATFAEPMHALLSRVRPTGMPPLYAAAPAAALLTAGDEAEAEAVLHAFRGGARLASDSEWLEVHWALADIAIARDDRPVCETLHALLVPYAGLWAVDGIGGAVYGCVQEILARLARHLGSAEEATARLREAHERYLQAGAVALSARVEALLSQPVRHRPAAPTPVAGHLRRDGRVWLLEWAGRRSTVPDSKGMRDLAVLLARPGRAVPAQDLVAAAGGPAVAATGGDLGPVLDESARHAYRARLAELDSEIDEADDAADLGRLERLRGERTMLVDQLAEATGLGGRVRIVGDPVERARKAVTMRIRAAIAALGEVDPALSRHLRNSVRTGRLCSYEPAEPVVWTA
jgi:hypothetical protein